MHLCCILFSLNWLIGQCSSFGLPQGLFQDVALPYRSFSWLTLAQTRQHGFRQLIRASGTMQHGAHAFSSLMAATLGVQYPCISIFRSSQLKLAASVTHKQSDHLVTMQSWYTT